MILFRERLWAIVDGRNIHPSLVPTAEGFPHNLDHATEVFETALRYYEEHNERAYATILLTINDGPLVHVQNVTDAKPI